MIQNLAFLIRLKLKVKSAKHLACVPPKNDPTFKISTMYTRNLSRAGIQLSEKRFIPRILEDPTFGLMGPIKSTSKLSAKYTQAVAMLPTVQCLHFAYGLHPNDKKV